MNLCHTILTLYLHLEQVLVLQVRDNPVTAEGSFHKSRSEAIVR